MKGVVPDRARGLDPDVGGDVLLRNQPLARDLAHALGAGAAAAEVTRAERARVSVLPADRHSRAALFPDLGGRAALLGSREHHSSMIVSGMVRNAWMLICWARAPVMSRSARAEADSGM